MVEENQKMRDSLLRTRKKLLSLANAASSLAEDETFQFILAPSGAHGKKSTQQQQPQAHHPPSAAASVNNTAVDEPNSIMMPNAHRSSEGSLNHVDELLTSGDANELDETTSFTSSNSAIDSDIAIGGSVSKSSTRTVDSIQLSSIMEEHRLAFPSFEGHGMQLFQAPSEDEMRNTFETFGADGISPIDVEMFSLRFMSPPADLCLSEPAHNVQHSGENAINVSSADILVHNRNISSEMFAASVEEAGVIYLAGLCGFRLSEPRSDRVKQISDPIEALKIEYLSVVDTQAVHDVAKIAISLITTYGAYGGLRSYVYGVVCAFYPELLN